MIGSANCCGCAGRSGRNYACDNNVNLGITSIPLSRIGELADFYISPPSDGEPKGALLSG